MRAARLKTDGSVIAWGSNEFGQCDVPEPNQDFVAISAGLFHSMGLKADGSVVAWGRNDYGQCNVPEPNEGFTLVSAGEHKSLALRGNPTPPPTLTAMPIVPGLLECAGEAFAAGHLRLALGNPGLAPLTGITVTLIVGDGLAGDSSMALASLAAGAVDTLDFLIEALPGSCGFHRDFQLLVDSEQTIAQTLAGGTFASCCGRMELDISYLPIEDHYHLSWPAVEGAQDYRLYGMPYGWPEIGSSTLLGNTSDTWLTLPRAALPETQFIRGVCVFPEP